ncbi:MAG: hypothetical protein IPO57_03610 [Rhodocyclales bacterium]|nr:hypothetical protein [Rhodocyclales bacterium]
MTPNLMLMKYVGFCDILGFSSAVLKDIDATLVVYREFQNTIRKWPFAERAPVSVYSDSIMVVGDELPPVLHTIGALNWAALLHGWLIRGGIAYGRYWEEREDGNLFVVSDALVKAVALEKTVKVPAVVVAGDIPLGLEAWVPRFQQGIFKAPLLHFRGLNIVNPFNPYWFKSATIRLMELLDRHQHHSEKYDWFLSLSEAVAHDDILIPEEILNRMLELGVLQKVPENTNSVPTGDGAD